MHYKQRSFLWMTAMIAAALSLTFSGCGSSSSSDAPQSSSSETSSSTFASSESSRYTSANSSSVSFESSASVTSQGSSSTVSESSSSIVNESSSSDSSQSVSNSSESSSVSSAASQSESSSVVSSQSSAVSSVPLEMSVTVSDAYVLEATVTANGIAADIKAGPGVYEWKEYHSGLLQSTGGANDLADPRNEATEADPKALTLRAPSGYRHINPFTEMLVAQMSTSTYPSASAVEGEDGLVFNYDVVEAGNARLGGDINIAKETAEAALLLSGNDSTENSAEIDACETNSCLDAILLREMMASEGPYEPECEPLPGQDCSSSSSSGTTSSASSVADSSSSTVTSSAANSSIGPVFPTAGN